MSFMTPMMASQKSSEEAVSSLPRETKNEYPTLSFSQTLFPISFPIHQKGNKTDLPCRTGQAKIDQQEEKRRQTKQSKTIFIFKVQNILKMEIHEITQLLQVHVTQNPIKKKKKRSPLILHLRPVGMRCSDTKQSQQSREKNGSFSSSQALPPSHHVSVFPLL